MPIATDDDIKAYARLENDAVLAAKTRLRRAERWVRQRVGNSTYDTAAAADPRTDVAESIAEAEALYAAALALHTHNLASKGKEGFVVVVQVDGSQSERLMSSRQLHAYRRQFEREAEEAIRDYMTVASPWGSAEYRTDAVPRTHYDL